VADDRVILEIKIEDSSSQSTPTRSDPSGSGGGFIGPTFGSAAGSAIGSAAGLSKAEQVRQDALQEAMRYGVDPREAGFYSSHLTVGERLMALRRATENARTGRNIGAERAAINNRRRDEINRQRDRLDDPADRFGALVPLSSRDIVDAVDWREPQLRLPPPPGPPGPPRSTDLDDWWPSPGSRPLNVEPPRMLPPPGGGGGGNGGAGLPMPGPGAPGPGVGPQLITTGMAVAAGLAAAATAAAVLARGFAELNEEVERARRVNAAVASAMQLAETRELVGDIRRARQNQDQLVDFVGQREEMYEALRDIRATFVETVGPAVTDVVTVLTAILTAVNAIAGNPVTQGLIEGGIQGILSSLGLNPALISLLRWALRKFIRESDDSEWLNEVEELLDPKAFSDRMGA